MLLPVNHDSWNHVCFQVNGKPVQLDLNGNQSVWEPDGQGYHKVSVVDKAGRSSEVVVHVLQRWQADGR